MYHPVPMRNAAFAALALTACSSALPFEPAGPGSAPDPSTSGPFAVGVKTIVIEDPTRPDENGEPRRLVTEVWYPAAESARDADGAVYSAADIFVDEIVEAAMGMELPGVPTAAVRDAPVNEDHGPFPLVVFSHGAFATRLQSMFYTVDLASHGYVVAAPDHTGNTLKDVENVDELTKDITSALGEVTQSLIDRAPDVKRTRTHLERWDDPIADQIDFDRYGVSGHSFGATTSLRSMATDSRIDAIVAHCPASYLVSWLEMPVELDEIDRPIMLMAGDDDGITPVDWVDSVWEHVQNGRYYELAGAGHLTFSDVCTLDPVLHETAAKIGLSGSLDQGCRPHQLPIERALPMIRKASIGYFNIHLRDSAETARYLDELAGEPEITDRAPNQR